MICGLGEVYRIIDYANIIIKAYRSRVLTLISIKPPKFFFPST
jgi:hypothetical protein